MSDKELPAIGQRVSLLADIWDDGEDHCAGPLKEQLEQVTKERDEEKRLRSELKEIARAGFDDISSLGATLKENAVIDFRSRAIALCRDKADEWQSLFDGDVTGDHDDKTYYARAANELASELEQLK